MPSVIITWHYQGEKCTEEVGCYTTREQASAPGRSNWVKWPRGVANGAPRPLFASRARPARLCFPFAQLFTRFLTQTWDGG